MGVEPVTPQSSSQSSVLLTVNNKQHMDGRTATRVQLPTTNTRDAEVPLLTDIKTHGCTAGESLWVREMKRRKRGQRWQPNVCVSVLFCACMCVCSCWSVWPLSISLLRCWWKSQCGLRTDLAPVNLADGSAAQQTLSQGSTLNLLYTVLLSQQSMCSLSCITLYMQGGTKAITWSIVYVC